MGPDLLPRRETFLCVACPGPAELLPSFLHFKEVSLHSLKDHMVALERAVQASTLLPTTLTTFVCKLCQEGTVSHFLSEEQLKIHMGKHSQFFVQRWKEFSEVQCRICEIVIDQELFEEHMTKAHSRNLFADPDKAKMVVENKEDFSQKLVCDVSEVTLHNDQEKKVGLVNRFDDRNSSQRLKLMNKGIRLKPIELLLDQSKKQPVASPACSFGKSQCLGCLKAKVDCGQCSVCLGGKGKMFQRERCLYVCQCKEEKYRNGSLPEISQADEACSKSVVNSKLSQLNTNQLKLIGIRKNISAQTIEKHFSRNGVQVAQVITSSGSGKVTFVDKKDVEVWDGKFLTIDNCNIRISNFLAFTEFKHNVVSIMKISATISVDDLYEFFSNEGVDVAGITIQRNRWGKVFFKNKEDAEYWADNSHKLIVKGIQLHLWRPIRKTKSSIETVEQSSVSADKPNEGKSCSKAENIVTSSAYDWQKERSSKAALLSGAREGNSKTGGSGRSYSDPKIRSDGSRPPEGHVRNRSKPRFNSRQKSRSRERNVQISRGSSRERSRPRGCARERSRFGNRVGSRDRSRSRYRSCSSDRSCRKLNKQ